jgi:hypothetical protein
MQVLAPNRPLAQYGITQQAVLELVPVEPSESDLPEGSPLLSDPSHGLYENWQQARAGLAHGQAPKLAAAGTGGSYFLQVRCACAWGGGKEGEGAQRGLWPVACGPGAAAVAAGAGLAATQPRPPPPPPPPPQDPSGANVAVFKPEDEEPLAINNPKGLGTSPNGEGLRRGTRPGEGAVREVRPRLPACLLALPCPAPRKPRFPPTCSGAAETRTACLEPS